MPQAERNAYQEWAELLRSEDVPAPGAIVDHLSDGTKIVQAKEIDHSKPPMLETISARDLQAKELAPLTFIVDSILPQGLSLLAAPSKYGKSWLSFDLCLSVAAGKPFLGYATSGGETLYLALEDGLRRLKGRMESILMGAQAPAGVHLATSANAINAGLSAQINEHLAKHPGTKLIVIDVLERIRSAGGRSTSAYTVDYQNMGVLKAIADEHNLCMLVIHHTRKMKDDSDVYNSISGTNGIMGACDTIWVMQRDNREDDQTKLFMTGRDIEQQSIVVTLDKAAHRWRKICTVEEQAAEREREDYEADPVVKVIKALLAVNPLGFSMPASEFLVEMGQRVGDYGGHIPSTLGKHFGKLAPLLLRYDDIIHDGGRSNVISRHKFAYRQNVGGVGSVGGVGGVGSVGGVGTATEEGYSSAFVL